MEAGGCGFLSRIELVTMPGVGLLISDVWPLAFWLMEVMRVFWVIEFMATEGTVPCGGKATGFRHALVGASIWLLTVSLGTANRLGVN